MEKKTEDVHPCETETEPIWRADTTVLYQLTVKHNTGTTYNRDVLN